jgi:chemotaxis protein MotB
MSRRLTAVVAVGFAVLASGCVSSEKYRRSESERAAMKAKADDLYAHANDLQQQLDNEKKQNASLNAERDDLLKKNEDSKSQYQGVLDQLQQEVQAGQLQVTQYKNMLSVDVAEKIFFASGSARLKETGKSVLTKVGDVLKQYNDKVIRVVGHTDNVPLGKDYQKVFPSNWELSVLRATNVVHFLQDEVGIPPERLIAAGRSQYDPVAPNDTAEGRQKNRRIEIELIDKNVLGARNEAAQTPAPATSPATTAPAGGTPEQSK